MEENSEGNSSDASNKKNLFEISSNWQINNNTNLHDAVTTVLFTEVSGRMNMNDIVSLSTCISLQTDTCLPCVLNIKLKNSEKICRIALVSDAIVLEFFKQSGEYATTEFATCVDEFEGHSVYLAEASIVPSSSEATIKFTRTKNAKRLWIYGIKLVLSLKEDAEQTNDAELYKSFINSFNNGSANEKNKLAMQFLNSFNNSDMDMFCKTLINSNSKTLNSVHRFRQNKNKKKEENNLQRQENNCNGDDEYSDNSINKKEESNTESEEGELNKTNEECLDIKKYIDNKFHDMELRVMERINETECKINQKLDNILKILQ